MLNSKPVLIFLLYGVGAAIAVVVIVLKEHPAATVLLVASGIILDDLREALGDRRSLAIRSASKRRHSRTTAHRRR